MSLPDGHSLGPSALELFAELPLCGVLLARDGAVVACTQRLRDLVGSDLAASRAAVVDLLRPDHRAAFEDDLVASITEGRRSSREITLRDAEGTYRQVIAELEPLARMDESVASACMIFTDVDERRRVEAALREQVAFNERLLAASDDCIKTLDLSGTLLTVNDRAKSIFDVEDVGVLIGSKWIDSWPPLGRTKASDAIDRARGGVASHFTAEFRSREGVVSWWEVWVTPIMDGGGVTERLLVISRDVSDRIAIEAARRTAIARLELLVTAERVLASSLDYATTLGNIARLAVEPIADVCLFDVVVGEGEPELVAVAHADRSREAGMVSAGAHLVSDPGRPEHPVQKSMRTGESTLVSATDAQWITRAATTATHAEFMTEYEYRSLIVVPVVNAETILGTLTLVLAGRDGRLFDGDDLTFAQELGRRAGVAVDNARLFTRQRHVAEALQDASLPSRLPESPRVTFDATYKAGAMEATIGGDWYDAFALRDGRIALTIGDVLGSGLRAAVTMTKVRQAMQSAALIVPDTTVMLEAAQQTLLLHSSDGIATAIAAIFDPEKLELEMASAGHPGPTVRKPDGRIEDVVVPGILLGLREGTATSQRLQLESGDVVAFYTDGLVEATRDIDEGMARLHRALGSPDVYAADRPARALMQHVLVDGLAVDDTAVLVATVR